MRRPINTVNGTYKDPNLAYSAQDALNVIPMMAEKGGTRTVSKYVDAPGLKPFCRIGSNGGGEVGFEPAGAGRGLRVVDNKLFVVAGRNLWQITSAGVSVNYGTIPGVGRVSMAHNQRGLGNELAIDNGQSRYVFNTQTQVLQKVTDESFPGSTKAFFIDGYLGYIEPQGRGWGHSDLSNGLNYISFDQYEAEGQPDRIVTGHVSNREVLIAGQDTIEAYVNSPSGSGEAPFVRATNTVIESGCSARDSFCTVGQFTVYLDQNRTVQVLNGYTPVPISTSVIDSALQSCTKQQIANAYAFAVEAEGFQIYYLTVPGKFTFGYDFKNKEWHRRSSTGLDWWAVTDVAQWNGRWYALDSRRGDILELRWRDYPFDVQEVLVREWNTGNVSADQNPVFIHELELLFGCGGKEYTTVDFPDQPLGPAITGAAPNGSIGIAYPGYTYTVTPGDAPIARTILRSGSTDLAAMGLSWNQSTASIGAGTPTSYGTVTLYLRTFDTNGLFKDHTDTFEVAIPLLVYGATSGVSRSMLVVPNGTDWSGPLLNTYDSGGNVLGIEGGRFISWDTGSLDYSDNFFTSKTDSASSLGGAGGERGGASQGDVVVIGGSLNGMYRSTDRAVTFTNQAYPGNPRGGHVAVNSLGTWATISQYETLGYTSGDDAATWTAKSAHGVTLSTGGAMIAVDEWFAIGGKDNATSKPVLALTQDFVTYTKHVISSATGDTVTSIEGRLEGDEYQWLIGTNDGQLFKSENLDAPVASAGSLGVPVKKIIHDGLLWVVGGGTTGVVKTSPDRDTWTTQTHPFNSQIIDMARYVP